MRIYNNIDSVTTQNQLNIANQHMSKSLERLSTGMRINRAADDAAGLSVSEGLRAQIRGSESARRNANDGLAMLQIAESGTQAITDSLQRMRELAIQSSNATYTNTDRNYMAAEFKQLACEITRITGATTYNGIDLLSGNAAATFTFQINGASTGSSTVVSYSAGNVSLGGWTSNSSINNALGGVSTQSAATVAIAKIDQALSSVLNLRSNIGSVMNRLEKTVDSLGVMITNYTNAESRVRDTDFATETTQFTRNQILTQSATSMLAQANQLPSGVLSLLR